MTETAAQIITFYSFKGGSGRTMAVANVAWLLAAAGRRVLAVDWDLESPGLHRYFRPFLLNRELDSSDGITEMLSGFIREIDRLQSADQPGAAGPGGPEAAAAVEAVIDRFTDFRPNVETIEWAGFPNGGRIDFLGPGRQSPRNGNDAVGLPWMTLFDDIDGQAYFAALRERMRRGGYDHVLIDSRTGTSDLAGICTLLLPDTVVVGFALNNQSIEGGAEVARQIRASERPIRVLPVPMRVEDTEQDKHERRRRVATHAFRVVLEDLWGPSQEEQRANLINLEIPYKAAYAYEEVLATFREEPASRLGVLAAFRLLTEALAGERIAIRPVAPDERARVLRAFEQTGPPPPDSVAIFAAPEDRPWADWLAGVLGTAGVRVSRIPPTVRGADDFPAAAALLVVASPQLGPDTPGEAAVREQVRGRGDALRRAACLVQVGAFTPDSDYAGAEVLALVSLDERDAAGAVLEHLGLPVPGGGLGDLATVSSRHPSRKPSVWSMPTTFTQPFIGRHSLLDALREQLLPGRRAVGPVPLVGNDGLGKSATAAAFAQRFESDYDIVYWIQAGDEASIRRGLADLALRLHPDREVPAVQRSPSEQLDYLALDALRRGEPSSRWLLVYDGAGDPADLDGLLPVSTPTGHVLITSSAEGWRDHPGALWLEPFPERDSRTFLRQWLPDAGDDRLELLAKRLENRPSGLRTAVGNLRQAWQNSPINDEAVDAYLARTVGERAEETTWAASFDTLRSAASPVRRAAARLLEMCAFLAPQGVPNALLESAVMLRRLAAHVDDASIADPTMLPQIWAELRRPRLAELDVGPGGELRLALRWQRLLRDRMSPDERADTRASVLGVLAEIALAAPRPSEPASWPVYRMLETQIVPAGAIDSASSDVRQWLVDQVFAMWRLGRLELGRDLAERALARWRELFGPDDPLTLRMATNLGILLRELGRVQQAYALNTDTLARQRRHLGIHHRHTLITAMSYGLDLRELGRYAAASAEESSTLTGLRRLLGDNHPDSLMAASNLTFSMFLEGRPGEALALSLDTLHRLRQVGAGNSAQYWWLQVRVGVCRRELGDLAAAERVLQEAATGLADLEGSATHLTLRARKHLAVALRRGGSADAALHLTDEILERYIEIYGDDDLGTIACRLSRAGHLHALGEHHEAAVTAEHCLRGYLRLYGSEHPFTNICRSDLSIYLRADGRLEEALTLATQAHAIVADELYLHHPFALATGVNAAAARVALGEYAEAHAAEEELLREAEISLDSNHPVLVTLRGNVGALATGHTGGPHGHQDVDIDISSV